MNVSQILTQSPLARLDTEVLLAHVLGKDRAWLYAHGDQKLTHENMEQWSAFEQRRIDGEPAAYIVGVKEFFGRPFSVTKDVLIPRPSTEGLIDRAMGLLKGEHGGGVHEIDEGIVALCHAFGVPTVGETLVDVGTGSGCIAVTLALSLPRTKIVAVDVSKEALLIGKENAKRHGVEERITFLHDDGISVVKSFADPFVMISNPPYIPDALAATLLKSVTAFEPHLALFAGTDGLSVLEPLLQSASRNPRCAAVAIECRADQVEQLLAMLRK